MQSGRPWNDEPQNLPQTWLDLAADYRRSAEWAQKEASADGVHPNDACRFDDEYGQWSLAATYLEEAGTKLLAAFAGRRSLPKAQPAPSWDRPVEQDAESKS